MLLEVVDAAGMIRFANARWEALVGSPRGEFVPLARELGLIDRLGLQVMRESCLQLALDDFSVGITAVAEGIATAKQAAQLREIGCRVGQGYDYARPVPAAQVSGLLARPSLGC